MQIPVPPRQILVSLVSGLGCHVFSSVESSEHSLYLSRANVVPAHEIVDQLIVITSRAHRTTHIVCFCPLILLYSPKHTASADWNSDVTIVFQHIFHTKTRNYLFWSTTGDFSTMGLTQIEYNYLKLLQNHELMKYFSLYKQTWHLMSISKLKRLRKISIDIKRG